jgi:HD-GYP domain-containing protein (c-di-GMP phosphodiesterase class II)
MLAAIAYPGPLALIVRHHHEYWDGTGYPDALAGDAIPVGARILAVADFYDALTSDRPYRRAFPHDRALAMLQDRAGRGYQPEIVQLFVTLVARLKAQPNGIVAPRFPDLVRTGWLTDARPAV